MLFVCKRINLASDFTTKFENIPKDNRQKEYSIIKLKKKMANWKSKNIQFQKLNRKKISNSTKTIVMATHDNF